MDDTICIEDLTDDDVADFLDLPEDEAAAILQFVQSVGGIENACDAVASLEQVREAA
jgi:hypothetical protein